MRSTSSSLSKTNITLCSPSLLTVKPLSALHSGLKVLATASVLSARRVKNLATMIYSFEQWSLLRLISSPFRSDKERQFQCFVRSSILIKRRKNRVERKIGQNWFWEKKRKEWKRRVENEDCFPKPQRKVTTSPTRNTTTRGEEEPYKKGQQILQSKGDGDHLPKRQRNILLNVKSINVKNNLNEYKVKGYKKRD